MKGEDIKITEGSGDTRGNLRGRHAQEHDPKLPDLGGPLARAWHDHGMGRAAGEAGVGSARLARQRRHSSAPQPAGEARGRALAPGGAGRFGGAAGAVRAAARAGADAAAAARGCGARLRAQRIRRRRRRRRRQRRRRWPPRVLRRHGGRAGVAHRRARILAALRHRLLHAGRGPGHRPRPQHPVVPLEAVGRDGGASRR